jgi:hypothetical protein
VFNLLRYGVAYLEKIEEEYAAQVRARRLKSLQRQARELGFRLQTWPRARPGGEPGRGRLNEAASQSKAPSVDRRW